MRLMVTLASFHAFSNPNQLPEVLGKQLNLVVCSLAIFSGPRALLDPGLLPMLASSPK